jgi:thymidylate synthase (FAD)
VKIIEPSVHLSTPFGLVDEVVGKKLLQWIEWNGRISHRSEDLMTEESYLGFLKRNVIDHGDWSIVEHSSVTAVFRVDRGITHELVRHRLFSFTQESTRFVRYGGKMVSELEFIHPINAPEGCFSNWDISLETAEKTYLELLTAGWRPQEARSVLPNCLAATITVTGNLRNWRHFLLMRTSKETHPDFRRVTIPLLGQFKTYIPILYDDIQPNERQIDNIKKAR